MRLKQRVRVDVCRCGLGAKQGMRKGILELGLRNGRQRKVGKHERTTAVCKQVAVGAAEDGGVRRLVSKEISTNRCRGLDETAKRTAGRRMHRAICMVIQVMTSTATDGVGGGNMIFVVDRAAVGEEIAREPTRQL